MRPRVKHRCRDRAAWREAHFQRQVLNDDAKHFQCFRLTLTIDFIVAPLVFNPNSTFKCVSTPLGRYFWRVHPQFTEPELTLIQSTWPQLPKKVNAAYENPEKDIVIIFSGLCFFSRNVMSCHCLVTVLSLFLMIKL